MRRLVDHVRVLVVEHHQLAKARALAIDVDQVDGVIGEVRRRLVVSVDDLVQIERRVEADRDRREDAKSSLTIERAPDALFLFGGSFGRDV